MRTALLAARAASGTPTVSVAASDFLGPRELAEMSYQFSAPFILDPRRSEEALGIKPTPFEDAVRATVDWWQARISA